MPKAKRQSGNVVVRALTRKFGPLPAWAWALIAGGAWYIYQRRKQAAAPATGLVGTTGAVTPPVDTGSGSLDGGLSGGGSGSSGGTGSGGGTQPPTPTPAPAFSTQIWIHGHPGYLYTYTGDPSVSAWFQVGGQWYYYCATCRHGPTPGSAGNLSEAFPAGDPKMPPGAGSPPGQSTSTSSGVGSPSHPQATLVGTAGQPQNASHDLAYALAGHPITLPPAQFKGWHHGPLGPPAVRIVPPDHKLTYPPGGPVGPPTKKPPPNKKFPHGDPFGPPAIAPHGKPPAPPPPPRPGRSSGGHFVPPGRPRQSVTRQTKAPRARTSEPRPAAGRH